MAYCPIEKPAGRIKKFIAIAAVSLERIISLAKDAETGQRGYIITGEAAYLEPYNGAIATIDEQVNALEQLVREHPAQQALIPALKNRIADRLKILQEGLALRKEKGFDAAREMILTDRGKIEMDELRGKDAKSVCHGRHAGRR